MPQVDPRVSTEAVAGPHRDAGGKKKGHLSFKETAPRRLEAPQAKRQGPLR